MMYGQQYAPYYQQQPPSQQQYQHHQQQKQSPQIHSSGEDNRTIWIGDLQQWMDEGYLHTCFAHAGEVLSVKVIRNKQTGQSERYGFVEFNSHASAEKVLQSYNGTMMPNAEQAFRLNWAGFSTGEKRAAADPGSDLSIFVGDLAPDVTDTLLSETFASRYSSVKGAKVVVDANTGRSKGYGFVRFGDENEKSRAMTEMNGVYCSSRPMRVGVATPKKPSTQQQQYSSQAVVLAGGYASNGAMIQASQSDIDFSNTTVFVGGIDSDVTDEDLRQSFCQFGDVISIKIPVGKGCGFVQFANRSSAEDAIQKLNGSVIGKNTVRLSWGRTPANKQQARAEANGQWGGAYYGRQSYGGYGHSMPPQNHDQNMYSGGSGYGGAANGDGNHHQPLN
nr:polyadenylate-binding protein RBP47-like isoform X1 [Ipomoea trifida]